MTVSQERRLVISLHMVRLIVHGAKPVISCELYIALWVGSEGAVTHIL